MNRAQIRSARALLDWSQEDLARASGVSIATIRRIEPQHSSAPINPDIDKRLTEALQSAGIVFHGEPGSFGITLVEGSLDRAAALREHVSTCSAALNDAIRFADDPAHRATLEAAIELVDKLARTIPSTRQRDRKRAPVK